MGRGADQTALSLEYLATNPSLSTVSQYQDFIKYFGGDERYSDTIIRYALLESSDLEAEQRHIVITGTLQYMVLYMAAIQYMEQSVKACNEGSDHAAEHWDTAASWLIGHLEGSSEAGSNEGRLLWALSKKNCKEFNSCSQSVPGSSEFNDQLVLKLYTGRGAVLAKTCPELHKTAAEIQSLLPIPLVQAALSTALKIRHSSGQRRGRLLAEGYVYSHAVLPLIEKTNSKAAATIAASFDLARGVAVPQGVSALVSAYSSSLSGLGIKCEEVGSSEKINVCAGKVQSNSTGWITGLVIGLLVSAGIGLVIHRRFFAKPKAEDSPVFRKKPGGELNHASEFASQPSCDDADLEDSTSSSCEDDSPNIEPIKGDQESVVRIQDEDNVEDDGIQVV